MYPIARFFHHYLKYRNAPALSPTDTHECTVICWPWDIDPWRELNNGRTLTLYDLGRVPAGNRMGLSRALVKNRWGLAVAGGSVRYRKRVTVFQRITMKTRVIGWDDRFVYVEQSMWVKGTCTSHILLRTAVTSRKGTVPPDQVLAAMGPDLARPQLPAWAQAWIDADATRPWPPEM